MSFSWEVKDLLIYIKDFFIYFFRWLWKLIFGPGSIILLPGDLFYSILYFLCFMEGFSGEWLYFSYIDSTLINSYYDRFYYEQILLRIVLRPYPDKKFSFFSWSYWYGRKKKLTNTEYLLYSSVLPKILHWFIMIILLPHFFLFGNWAPRSQWLKVAKLGFTWKLMFFTLIVLPLNYY